MVNLNIFYTPIVQNGGGAQLIILLERVQGGHWSPEEQEQHINFLELQASFLWFTITVCFISWHSYPSVYGQHH